MTEFQSTLFFSGLAAGADLMGGAVVAARRRWDAHLLGAAVAVGAGFMLAATLLEIIPASLQTGETWLPALILAGYLLVHVTQRVLATHVHLDGRQPHHPHPPHDPDEPCEHAILLRPGVGLSTLVGFLLHTFFDGVSIGAGFSVSSSLGMLVFLAVILHKVPEGVTLASIVLACGGGRGLALGATGLIGVATVTGACLTGLLTGSFQHHALAVAGGVTLYVAASDLVPEVEQTQGRRGLLLMLTGVMLFWVTDRLIEVAGRH